MSRALDGGPVHRAAVAGSPISHSLSPVLHEAGYRALELTGWHYGRHQVVADELAGFVGRLDDSWRGLSLTMPLKEAAFEVASEVSQEAERARAINTLVPTPSGWRGENTDIHGILAALRDTAPSSSTMSSATTTSHAVATVIGSGATARSAVLALGHLGVEGVRVAARNATRAAASLAGLPTPVEIVPLQQWADSPGAWVVCTLPAGEANESAAAALRRSGSARDLAGTGLLDVVYAGWPTPLARAADQAGASVISGVEMLIHQAAAQFALFTGRPAPLPAMQAAGRDALRGG